MDSDNLRIDESGGLWERGLFGGWAPKMGLFGQEFATGLFGTPQMQQGLLGPVRGSEPLFGQSTTPDGKPLFIPDL